MFVAAPPGAPGPERLADEEVLETACAVQAVLQRAGVSAALTPLDPDGFDRLAAFDWIFNLAETVRPFPLADHQIAAELERRAIPFTGAGSRALHACLDKPGTKACLQRAGLPTPPGQVYLPDRPLSPPRLRFPLLVKPACEDGSIGIDSNSLVRTTAELYRQVRRVHAAYRQAALVEQYIPGQDVSASILQAACLPLSFIEWDHPDPFAFLTYESKWSPETDAYRQSRGVCPSQPEPQLARRLNALALSACQVMGCCDYASVDFRVCEGRPSILEVNPNPCINPHGAGYVRAARAAGYDYDALVCRILDLSIQHYNLSLYRKTGAPHGYFLEAFARPRPPSFGDDAGPYSGV